MGYREKCLEEKGEQCEFCGAEENIVVHHIDGNRQNNRIGNLIPVCESCHSQIHNSKSEEYEKYTKMWEDSETVTLSPDEQESVAQFFNVSPALGRDRDLDSKLSDLVSEAVEEKYDYVSISRDHLKALHEHGWVVKKRLDGQDVLIEIETDDQSGSSN